VQERGQFPWWAPVRRGGQEPVAAHQRGVGPVGRAGSTYSLWPWMTGVGVPSGRPQWVVAPRPARHARLGPPAVDAVAAPPSQLCPGHLVGGPVEHAGQPGGVRPDRRGEPGGGHQRRAGSAITAGTSSRSAMCGPNGSTGWCTTTSGPTRAPRPRAGQRGLDQPTQRFGQPGEMPRAVTARHRLTDPHHVHIQRRERHPTSQSPTAETTRRHQHNLMPVRRNRSASATNAAHHPANPHQATKPSLFGSESNRGIARSDDFSPGALWNARRLHMLEVTRLLILDETSTRRCIDATATIASQIGAI